MTKYEWLKVSWNKNYAPHYLPCCPHLDNPNMLLMLGVPPYAADEHFTDFLGKYGKVVQVMSQDRPSAVPKFHIPNDSKYFRDSETTSNFRCVFVQFLEEAGMNSFLTNCKQGAVLNLTESSYEELVGTQKWVAEYKNRYPDEDKLRAECEKYMDEYDAREAEKLKREKEMFETPDDEGWVTVTKSNKMGASLESAAEKKKQYDQKMKKKLKETLHMYSFQEREQKKETLATLKKKFQEDKDKIAKMKALRKFKPY